MNEAAYICAQNIRPFYSSFSLQSRLPACLTALALATFNCGRTWTPYSSSHTREDTWMHLGLKKRHTSQVQDLHTADRHVSAWFTAQPKSHLIAPHAKAPPMEKPSTQNFSGKRNSSAIRAKSCASDRKVRPGRGSDCPYPGRSMATIRTP